MADSLKKYSDRVLGYLRDAYGIDAEVQHGGKHPCVAFNWQGVDRRITLRHDGGARGFDLKRQDIRRVLGTPPATMGETAMVMIETTMPHQVAPPTFSAAGGKRRGNPRDGGERRGVALLPRIEKCRRMGSRT